MKYFGLIMEFRAIFSELRWDDLNDILAENFYFKSTAREFTCRNTFVNACKQMAVIYEEKELHRFSNAKENRYYFVVEQTFYGETRYTAIVHSEFHIENGQIKNINLAGKGLPKAIINNLYAMENH